MAGFTGKIRVKENIGNDSKETFGEVGTLQNVENGKFDDLEGFTWSKNYDPFNDVDDINEYFSYKDMFQTVFELAEEYT